MPSGLSGAGIGIADVEYEWSATHADLVARKLLPARPTALGFDARDHGTAVLGILGAADDGHGITGLAPGATLHPFSPIYPGASPGSQPAYHPANAIADVIAASRLGPGDVLLIELQADLDPSPDTTRLAPIESYPGVRDEIAKAVGNGIVVVEPAGNQGLDIGRLDIPWLSDPTMSSGALIVGAGGVGTSLPEAPSLQRVPGSNWGARVDVQGVGAGVVTTGFPLPGAPEDSAYTPCFDGTSSASATVAAAVAVLQGAVKAQRGTPLTPAQVRDVLRGTGLPQASAPGIDPASENIGPRPQVAAALAALSVTPPPSSDPDTRPAFSGGADVTPVPVAPDARATGVFTGPRLTPAATGMTLGLDRRRHRLTVRLRGAARSAIVRVGTRRVTLRNGVLVLRGVRPGRIVVRVAAGAGYRAVAFRVSVPVSGAPRVARIG